MLIKNVSVAEGFKRLLCYLFLLTGTSAHAQDTITSVELMERLGIDFDTIQIRSEKIAPGIYVLFGAGGNVLTSIGTQGVLIVDDQFPSEVPKIRSEIRRLGGGEIDFAINTHWHADHADGNRILGKDGSWIIAHSESRLRMRQRQLINVVSALIEQPPYARDSLPVITFENKLALHFNDDLIELLHYGPGHTTGDTIVYFRNSNVVHMGDTFIVGMYPFIDTGNGGSLEGIIRTCASLLDEINQATVIVPGHGPVSTYDDLVRYIDMLRKIQARVSALLADGATLDDILAEKPTAEWDNNMSRPPLALLDRIVNEMKTDSATRDR